MGGRRHGLGRGVLGVLVAVAVVATATPTGAVAGFRDVPHGAFYTAPVQWALNNRITTGVGGTDVFEPLRSVTRAESATMVWRWLGRPAGSAPRFADQVPGSWYDAALLWGRGRITTGVGGSNHFHPDRSVTRAEAATMIWRAAGSPRGSAPRFADQVPGSWYDAALLLGRGRITTGVGGSNDFHPDRSVTRAELVTMVYRAAGSPRVRIDPNPPYRPPVMVYLTFDDGPHPAWTPQVLDVLREHGAQATFFAIGSQVQRYPGLARRIVAEGHRIENHTMNHARLTNLGWAGIRAELAGADQAVRAAVGQGTRCFRPPFGATNRTVVDAAGSIGLRQVLWTVDSSDWKRPPPSQIVGTVLGGVRPGGVVLLHDGGGDRSRTVAALDTILPELRRRGYSFGLVCG